MRPGALGVAGLALLAVLAALAVAPVGAAGPAQAPGVPSLAGNVTGPSLLATDSNTTFYLNASGGPADSNGVFNGTIGWNATLSAANLTGAMVTPSNGTIKSATAQPVHLTVATGTAAETMRLTVRLTSSLGAENTTLNVTASFRVVVPYVVHAQLVVGAGAIVLPFNVTVALDGTVVGVVRIPEIAPNSTYDLAYDYPSAGLGVGDHTFTLTITDAHGLVTFSNGLTVQTVTFYVAPAPVSYTVWYVAGVVAFFGVLFIYASRVAARRRGTARR